MSRYLRGAGLVTLLGCAVLLAGCPPGAGGQGQQNVPPGIQPPPGLDSGGARTLMGTTITAPSDSFLLVKFAQLQESIRGKPPAEPKWQSCRRVIPMDWWVLAEGLNYDGRDAEAEKDVNQLIPSSSIAYFYWKYQPKPAPPAEEKQTPGKKGK